MLLFNIVLPLMLVGFTYGQACSIFGTWRIGRVPIRKSKSIERMDLPTEDACTEACQAITPLLCASNTYNEETQECLLNIYRWRLSRRASRVEIEICLGCAFSWTSGEDKRLLKRVNGRALSGKMSELDCQARCEEETEFHCASVNYHNRKQKCYLLKGSASDMPYVDLSRNKKFIYYDRELVCQDCSNHGCQNGATCSPETRGYRCVCGPGYAGDYCEIDIDDCIGHQCENGGACVDGDNAYTCACAAGYAGEFCGENIDECVDHECEFGTCVDGVNGYTCDCMPGFSGVLCDENIDECVGHQCLNGATCTDGVNGYTCVCVAGYRGERCGENIDECVGHQCHNGATCADGVNAYTCTCAPGYRGPSCGENIDECVGHECLNGATCVDEVNGYTCDCAPGYRGARCFEDIDECVGHQCLNGATCMDGVNGYTCICTTGFDGARCGENIDDCPGNRCQNGATCVDGINAYFCTCLTGYIGVYCEINYNDCPGHNCLNGATCVDGINAYTCACAEGYIGASCGDIDPAKVILKGADQAPALVLYFNTAAVEVYRDTGSGKFADDLIVFRMSASGFLCVLMGTDPWPILALGVTTVLPSPPRDVSAMTSSFPVGPM